MSEQILLSTEDCVLIDDFLFFFAVEINALCKMDIESGDVFLVSSIPEEAIWGVRLGMAVFNIGEYIFISPGRAKKIWRYDIASGEWKSYMRKDINKLSSEKGMLQMALFENKLFVIGSRYPAIMVINISNDTIEYIVEPYKRYSQLENAGKDIYFRTDNVIVDDTIYLASCIDNSILKLNMASFQYEIIKVGSEYNAFSGIGFDGEKYIISPRKGDLLTIWDGKGHYEEVMISELGTDMNKVFYTGVVCWENSVILPAFSGRKTVVVGEDKEVSFLNEEYCFMKKLNNEVLVSLSKEGLIKVRKGTSNKEHFLSIEKEKIYMFIEGRVKESKSMDFMVNENSVFDLNTFLKMVR